VLLRHLHVAKQRTVRLYTLIACSRPCRLSQPPALVLVCAQAEHPLSTDAIEELIREVDVAGMGEVRVRALPSALSSCSHTALSDPLHPAGRRIPRLSRVKQEPYAPDSASKTDATILFWARYAASAPWSSVASPLFRLRSLVSED
jgi:hypothetical protein